MTSRFLSDTTHDLTRDNSIIEVLYFLDIPTYGMHFVALMCLHVHELMLKTHAW